MELKLENKIEQKESIPVIETVRTALFYKGKFLILKKNNASKNPGGLEFPGGKIDDIKGETSTIEEQKNAAYEEARQETGIDINNLPIEEITSFKNYFEISNKDGVKKKYKRLIHLFLIRIPDTQEISLSINETKNEKGESEDKHESYVWVLPNELIDSATLLKENSETGEQVYPLSRNSRAIKDLLKAVGHLKDIESPSNKVSHELVNQESK